MLKFLVYIEYYTPPLITEDPCYPSPCGLYATCANNGGKAQCSCLPDYLGIPPNCHPECTTNDDCANNLACINKKCRDPCPGSCGLNTNCIVTMHIPNCMCRDNLIGDPFNQCYEPLSKLRSKIHSYLPP